MILYYDNRFETVNFGMKHLKKSIEKNNILYVEKPLSSFTGGSGQLSVIASFVGQGVCKDIRGLEEGGFDITKEDSHIYITGGDHVGLMYGILDVAETIEFYGVEGIKCKTENPFLKMRGVKFNLPFEPYANGDPFEKNIKTCLDINFWRDYIDFLALNRYNCLSLWSEHPFHMMFRLEKYPYTCPYSDVELEKYKDVYKFIFRHAKMRGLKTYLITWNIRITPFVAKGLGLPEELGDMSGWYNYVYDSHNKIPYSDDKLIPVRQHLPIIKDYFRECIKTLVTTYSDLDGIGTNCAEEMAGDAIERQNWVMETYLEAIKETGRDMPFIMRTNMGSGKIAKEFLDRYPSKEKYISWKYSNAHMYSHPKPRFEELWGAWDGVNLEDVKAIFTVRNDDFHTLRGGDYDFIRDYIKGMKKPYVHGFYWGADGYTWASDFQHVPFGHKFWKYDFEKHWHQFELLGRLGYNPDMSEDIWIQKYKRCYGKAWGRRIYHCIKKATKIIQAVNRLAWINYDYEWHPESLLSVFGFRSVLDFMNSKPMPGIGTIGIREYVKNDLNGRETEGETPVDIIKIIKESVENIRIYLKQLREEIPHEYMHGELKCTLMDIEAWEKLGDYYYNKLSASLDLVYFQETGDQNYRNKAVRFLEQGLDSWKQLSLIWSQHYQPYMMSRVRRIFGYPYYIEDVERDIEIAKGM